ncbi:ATP-dependent RNA helicase DbpA [Bowmanella sp. JS7-9]|uniref:ATP-dependent RNA helicase DbpA n=1 Tax=Pseudobowmanella zhangzhouensis TaxID=1537679 RepID=A0ABW1XIL3_9ALTE|nr:ATP-dependent RNA helicase DbpA [Bowmanella sp. JS7-9]TBX21051.1 hypothetical protein TK45_12890 [Bowmanella sp. JS7-9]
MSAFSQFSLPDSLLANLDSMGIQNPTEIQQAALPALLAGDDLIAQAATGSGKTLTFALPIALKVTSDIATQALVLCPTRELAEQVADTIRTVLRVVPNIKVQTLCGGQPMGPQIQSLRHAPQVIVATPGRLVEHVEKRRVDLRTVSQLVLDEADRMLDVGFADDLDVIFHAMAPGHQTMLFSATYTDEINRMCETWLPTAQKVEVATKVASITQQFYRLGSVKRYDAVARILSHHQPASAMIFTNTKREAAELAEVLKQQGFAALAIHGDLEQRERNQVLAQFANGSCLYLIATDVAARGLDIPDVAMVVNLQPAHDVETHVHRIGRTGRAGREGLAVTLISDDDTRPYELLIERFGAIKSVGVQNLVFHANRILQPVVQTVLIQAGKKQKIRKGDIVGLLTRDDKVPSDDIVDIQLTQLDTYLAIKQRSVKRTLQQLRENRLKGIKVIARKL